MDAASQRSVAIKAIMSDTSLTPQEKQKKMLELNKVATSSAAITTSTTISKPTSTSDQRNPASGNGSGNTVTDSRAAKIQQIVKDTSLTALQRQKKIQEIMKQPAMGTTTAAAAAVTNGTTSSNNTAAALSPIDTSNDSNRQAIQSIISRDSLDPQMKQEKIKGVIASGGSGGDGVSTPTSNTAERQQFVQTLMNDTTLTPQEKQKRIREEISQPSTSEAIQTIVARNSLDPQMKQEKIKDVIAASSRNVNAVSAASTKTTTATTPTNSYSSDRQLFVQTLMQDKTLTPQEKQKRIKEKLNEPSQRIAATPTASSSSSSKTKDNVPPSSTSSSSAKEELLRRSFGASAQAVEALKEQAAMKKEETKQTEKGLEVNTAVAPPPSSEAEKEILRRSFGASAQAVEALKEQASTKKEEEANEKARSRLSYGSPTAAIAAMRSSADDDKYDFSHIRKAADEKQSSKPEPKGTRVSQIGNVVPKPPPKDPSVEPKRDVPAASKPATKASEPKPKPVPTKAQPTKPTAAAAAGTAPPKSPTTKKAPEPSKSTNNNKGGGTTATTTTAGETDGLLPSMKLPPKPTATTRSSIQGSKRRFDENNKEITETAAKNNNMDSESRSVPVPVSNAKNVVVNNDRNINVGAEAPKKGILKSDTPSAQSAEAGCCIIL